MFYVLGGDLQIKSLGEECVVDPGLKIKIRTNRELLDLGDLFSFQLAGKDAVEVFNPFSTTRMQVIADVTLFSELVYDYAGQEGSEEAAERETKKNTSETGENEHSSSETPTPVKSKRVPKQRVFQDFVIQRMFQKASVYQLFIL